VLDPTNRICDISKEIKMSRPDLKNEAGKANPIPDKKEKAPAIAAQVLSQLLLLPGLALFLFTLHVEATMGGFALFGYIFFLPVLILFFVVGSLAARRSTKFAKIFYYENIALTVLSILGIFYLILAIHPTQDYMFGPGEMNFEHVLQDLLLYTLPCGVGLAIGRFIYKIRKRKTDLQSPPQDA
jgi:hypothetical protein